MHVSRSSSEAVASSRDLVQCVVCWAASKTALQGACSRDLVQCVVFAAASNTTLQGACSCTLLYIAR